MNDVRRLYSIGLPVGSLIACLAIALASPAIYRNYVRKHESGVLEHGTIICLVPAVVLGIVMLRNRQRFPSRWVVVWVTLLAAGALYYAGEECSWGQNYFHWATPESWSTINDQNETNLHNTSGVFDHAPRALLSAAVVVCAVVPIVRRFLTRSGRGHSVLNMILPTMAVVPTALIAALVGLPQKIHGRYEKTGQVESWLNEMFLNGRHSELKEFYLAMFILMYMWSLASRTRDSVYSRQHDTDQTAKPPREVRSRQAA